MPKKCEFDPCRRARVLAIQCGITGKTKREYDLCLEHSHELFVRYRDLLGTGQAFWSNMPIVAAGKIELDIVPATS